VNDLLEANKLSSSTSEGMCATHRLGHAHAHRGDGKFTFLIYRRFKSQRDYANGYGYFYLDYPKRVTWTPGGGITDYAESNNGANHDFSPKLGARGVERSSGCAASGAT
jgi:hypothetical protein